MAGKYKKQHVLGTGSFGKAWVVVDQDNNKNVLKEIKLTSLSDKEIDQALVEVTVLSKCNHINIIKYVEACVENKCLHIVMEYADAGDLQQKILGRKGIYFAEEVVCDLFVQISYALQYLHNKNILHRDLKPQNVFLTRSNVVKLGDFGISRILQHTEDRAMTAIGTPYYLSPEICHKQPYNHKSDMWALGCILYELCCLKVPFEAPNLTSLVLKIVEGNYMPIPSLYGPLIEDLVGVLIHPNADKRPSANQLLAVPKLQQYVKKYLRDQAQWNGCSPRASPAGSCPSSKKCWNKKGSIVGEPVNLRCPVGVSSPVPAVPRRRSIPKVKVTGRRASVPCLMKYSDRYNPASPVKILNGKVVDAGHVEPIMEKSILENKENLECGKTYKLRKPRVLLSNSLMTPAVNTLLRKQKRLEVQSCQLPKRVERDLFGPAPQMKLFGDFLKAHADRRAAVGSQPSPLVSNTSIGSVDDDVFDTGCKSAVVMYRSEPSCNSLTYKLNKMTMEDSPTKIKMPSDAPSMQQMQVLYESVLENHGSTRQAVVTLTSYLQDQLGSQQFNQLYSLVLDNARSAVEFKVVREKAGNGIVYLPIIIQLLQLEKHLG